MIFIYFILGLVFFILGILSFFFIQKNSTLRIAGFLSYLGLFGVIRGFYEWGNMFLLIPDLGLAQGGVYLQVVQLVLMTASFFCLFQFGYLIYMEEKPQLTKSTVVFLSFLTLGFIYLIIAGALNKGDWYREMTIIGHYFLGIAGGILSALAMFRQSKQIESAGLSPFARNFTLAGVFFVVYVLFTEMIVPKGMTFPSQYLNEELFRAYLGIPVDIIRTLITIGLTYFLFNGFRVYAAEERERLYSRAVTDELTGLYNHRYFQERLEEELARSRRQNIQTSLLILDIDHFKIYNDQNGHPAGDLLLKDLAGILKLNLRDMDTVARYGGEEFAVILPNAGSQQAYEVAERIRQQIEDHPFFNKELQPEGKVTVSLGLATFPTDAQDKSNLIKFADLALYKAKDRRNRVEIYFSILDDLKNELDSADLGIINTIKTLITVINAVDHYTYGHSERVVGYAEKTARLMGLKEAEVKLIKYGAFLHDIGKIEIDRSLLSKTDALTNGEKLALRQHPNLGAEIIRPIKPLRQVVPYILYHQEHFDGKGYPEGLKGEDIPLGARIIAVADSFDAMTTSRSYRAGKSEEEAIEELRKCTGTQFDPTVVEAFLKTISN